MKIERTRNATRNLFWGIISKIVGLIVPFICRGAIIRIFGINYLGLNSLFSSILYTLNLAELGFGSSIVYFMYQAIAMDDTKKICALMEYYKKIYRIIGSVILGLGLLIMPFLPFIIKKDIPNDINIYWVYLLTLSGTAVTYFLFAYKNSILVAFQRNDIVSKISTIIMLIERFVQLYFIIIVKNYYLYLGATVILNAVNNIVVARYADKLYPDYRPTGNISQDEKKQIGEKIKGLFLYKIGGILLSSGSNIIISSFIGLTVAGIYGNYYFVVSTLFSFLAIYYSSIRAGLGNSIAVDTIEKNFEDFKLLQFLQNWICGWCTVCLLCLFQDFIQLYAGEKNKLPIGLVVCICCYFYFWKVQDIVHVYKEASGLWDTDKYRPLTGGFINFLLSCILVQFIGLYGIILSTIFVLIFIDIPWASHVLLKECFHKSQFEYFKMLAIGTIETLIMIIISYLICFKISCPSLLGLLFVKAIICIFIPNIIFVMFNIQKTEFHVTVNRVRSILKI